MSKVIKIQDILQDKAGKAISEIEDLINKATASFSEEDLQKFLKEANDIIAKSFEKSNKGFQVIDITKLNGRSHTAGNLSLRKLTLAIDLWINKNNGLIKSVSFSKGFDNLFLKENGFRPNMVATLVGDAKVIRNNDQVEDVVVE